LFLGFLDFLFFPGRQNVILCHFAQVLVGALATCLSTVVAVSALGLDVAQTLRRTGLPN